MVVVRDTYSLVCLYVERLLSWTRVVRVVMVGFVLWTSYSYLVASWVVGRTGIISIVSELLLVHHTST
jgi:hypothetical protein